MKAIEKVSIKATKPMTSISINTVEFPTKKFWLPLIFGASLIYMGNPLHAGERQDTESQGSGRGTMPVPGYTDDRAHNQGTNRSGNEEMGRGTSPSGERGTDPDVNMGNRSSVDSTRRGTSSDTHK